MRTPTRPLAHAARALLACLILAAALLPAGCARRERPQLSVLLIVVDSMRADHLGVYGYHRPTSPRIDALARDGVVFNHAVSQAPWTRPSVASLFTSTYISVHQVLYSERVVNGQQRTDVLNEKFLTLAEAMQAGGFATGGFGMKIHLHPEFGFSQGFEGYNMRSKRADKINARTLEWLRGADPERFFIYLHYNDPHYPYTPRKGVTQFGTGQTRVQINGETKKAFREGSLRLTPDDARELVDLYDTEILYTDQQIGKLVDTITGMGYSNLLVLVTADHGEEFLDHGDITHGHSLYGELVRVPLVVGGSALQAEARGRRSDMPVQIIDIMPTLLELAGLPPPPGIQGLSFARALRAGASVSAAEPLPVFGERREPEDAAFSETIVQGPWKLIHDGPTQRATLFDLAGDPNERTPVASGREDVVTQLQARLAAWRDANKSLHDRVRPDESTPLDPETREKLRSLGYIQ